MGNVEFISNTTYHIELWFDTQYTLEEITNITNKYIKNCSHYFESQTQIPKYYKTLLLRKEPSILW